MSARGVEESGFPVWNYRLSAQSRGSKPYKLHQLFHPQTHTPACQLQDSASSATQHVLPVSGPRQLPPSSKCPAAPLLTKA